MQPLFCLFRSGSARCVLGFAGLVAASCPVRADVQLYETGPSQDSSYVRFVNASEQALEVEADASKVKLVLTPASPASDFQPVRARSEINGALLQGALRQSVSLSVQPGEFASVLGLADGKGGLVVKTVREKPDSFNALKASVGFVNIDPACTGAGLSVAGRDVALFENVSGDAVVRRMINPVALSVQLVCAGVAVGSPLDLGVLKSGQRYSVFVVPSPKGSKLVHALDSIAN
jgi:hypothetical protein